MIIQSVIPACFMQAGFFRTHDITDCITVWIFGMYGRVILFDCNSVVNDVLKIVL